MKNNYLLMVILLLGVGCGTKKQNTQGDVAPAFKLQSTVGTLELNVENSFTLKRDDPTVGPKVQIQPLQIDNVATAEKNLSCPANRLIQGKIVRAPDTGLFSFQLSESEFPGLSALPSVSKCSLTVVLTNNIGSTFQVVRPVTIQFDRPQSVFIIRARSRAGLQPALPNGEFVIDTYNIKNSGTYPLGFIFRTDKSILGTPVHVSKCPNDPQGCRPMLYKITGLETAILPSRISLVGNAEFLGGDYFSEVRFRVPPGETVTVTSLGRMTGIFQHVGSSLGLPDTRSTHSVYGIIVRINPAVRESLSIWRELELTPRDLSEPVEALLSIDDHLDNLRPATDATDELP